MIALEQLNPAQLSEGCRKAGADNSYNGHCFELFRRAIVEKSQVCWGAIYTQYSKLVYRWTLEYAKSSQTIGDITVDEMVQDAFTAFWRTFSAQHLANAEGLSSVLRYLKSCAWSSVQQVLRKVKDAPLQLDESLLDTATPRSSASTTEKTILHEIVAEKFWQVLDSCCSNDRERTIARLRFVNELKPSEIVKRYPDLASDEKELFKLLRNLKDRIERSEQMRELQKEILQ